MKTIPSTAVLLLALWLSACAASPEQPVAAAQPGFSADMSAEQMAAERQRINRVRVAEENRFSAAEAACYQRFAVNDCLTTVQRARRTVREELRRQEIALNDIERQQRAAEHWHDRAGPDGKLPPLPVMVPGGVPATATP